MAWLRHPNPLWVRRPGPWANEIRKSSEAPPHTQEPHSFSLKLLNHYLLWIYLHFNFVSSETRHDQASFTYRKSRPLGSEPITWIILNWGLSTHSLLCSCTGIPAQLSSGLASPPGCVNQSHGTLRDFNGPHCIRNSIPFRPSVT